MNYQSRDIYRQAIQSILKEYARLFNHKPEGVDVIAVCDETTDTYAIVNVGWDGKERLNATTVLLRIVNGKIWVEEDRTMYGCAGFGINVIAHLNQPGNVFTAGETTILSKGINDTVLRLETLSFVPSCSISKRKSA